MDKTIHCIGDSHASFFSGQDKIQPCWPEKSNDIIPFFKSYRLGAVLAYNLCSSGTETQGNEKLFKLLKQIPRHSYIMLIFGEIDCRAHLLLQAEYQKKDIKQVVEVCIKRYFTVILQIKKMGYKVLVWNAIPTTPFVISNEKNKYPSYGTVKERNHITMLFNNSLSKLLEQESIPMITIFDNLVNRKGITKKRYLMDRVHLSQKAMRLTINEINKKVGFNN